jgi:formylglycine-generating enzyme required for sulfatase activity
LERSPARLALLFGQARLGTPQLAELVREATTAPGWEGENFVRALLPHREQALEVLRRECGLLELGPQSHPKARLAILAFCLGDPTMAESMAKPLPDPAWRTSLVAQFGEFRALAAMPAEAIERSTDAALRSALCLGLGGMANPSPPDELRAGWAKRLEAWHADSPSAPLHSASGWALNQWGVFPKPQPTREGPPSERDWFVNATGLTFLRIPAGSTTFKDRDFFQQLAAAERQLRDAGDTSFTEAPDDDEFWMSDCEVPSTVFFEFYNDADVPAADRLTRSMLDPESPDNSPTPYPMRDITFADAALFCNWLSQREGRKPCYERTGRMLPKEAARTADLWRVVPNANGYRLPWASEWIRACRAGTVTEFGFGNHDQRLRDYGVFQDNSGGLLARVRSRRCNSWGLFDMHGNLFEWCNDRTDVDKFRYIVQGGCFTSTAGDCASQPFRKESTRRGAATRSPFLGMRLVIRP